MDGCLAHLKPWPSEGLRATVSLPWGHRSVSREFYRPPPYRGVQGLHWGQLSYPCPLTETPAADMPVRGDGPPAGKRKLSGYMSTVLCWALLSQAWVLGPTSMAQDSSGEKIQCLILETPMTRSAESFARALEADSSHPMAPAACRRTRATGQCGK